uniref:DNA binding protein n=1 Tax=Rhizophora mucronata TaxID=61149 RepID=A0A2P2JL90_RHIMU
MTRKPEGSNVASSGNISSIGAKTSSEQAPTALSSTPLHICKRCMFLGTKVSCATEWPSSRTTSRNSSCSIV